MPRRRRAVRGGLGGCVAPVCERLSCVVSLPFNLVLREKHSPREIQPWIEAARAFSRSAGATSAPRIISPDAAFDVCEARHTLLNGLSMNRASLDGLSLSEFRSQATFCCFHILPGGVAA